MNRILFALIVFSCFSMNAYSAPDSGRYYPLDVGTVLYFDAVKSENNEKLNVKMEIQRTEIRDNTEYFYLFAPSVDIRYLIRKDAEGVYMKYIKIPFPVVSFIMIEAEMCPEMKFVGFPLKTGAKWSHKGRAVCRLFGIIPVERDIKADFEIIKRETLQTGAGPVDTYCVEVFIDSGDGKGLVKETHWYGLDTGYTGGKTVIYSAMLSDRQMAVSGSEKKVKSE